MQKLFHNFSKNILNIFYGKNLVWHLVAIFLTLILVFSGWDWSYFLATQKEVLNILFFPAVLIGGLLPMLLPLGLLFWAKIRKNYSLEMAGWALVQAALSGWLISSVYKAFTGRIPPPHIFRSGLANMTDSSHGFQFGILRGGIFWGWPSSHTTIAFAMAFCLCALYPKNKFLRFFVIAYAIYVGLGVSMSIHWLSEAVAGAIIGAVTGLVIGKGFSKQQSKEI